MTPEQIDRVTTNKFLMTPQKAQQLLNCNTKNRKSSDLAVSLYKRDMSASNFMLNGTTVCMSDTGVLLDGQQRLMACVQSGKPFWTILVENLPEEAILTIDSGKKRTYGDRLKINGYENYNSLAATIKMVALIAVRNAKDTGYTTSELDEILNKHPNIVESVTKCRKTYHKADNLFSAMHYVGMATGYEDQINEFIRTWRDGQINYENDPVVYIRNKLDHDSRQKNGKMTTVTRMKLIMLSWHKFKNFHPLKSAQISNDGFYMDDWDAKKCGIK